MFAAFARYSFLACLIAVPACAAEPRKPDIIVILSDDMGFSDLGCYGGEISTPNLDSLAANGLRFTQFYNTARCCPTRASLLTGMYPHQAGVGHMTDDRGHDGYRGELSKRCVTIAEALRPAGYATFLSGKWHVTRRLSAQTAADRENWPLQRGFDRFYGTIIGGGSFWDPSYLTRGNAQISAFADPAYQPAEPYYYTDAITDNALQFVKEHTAQQPDKPFFLYVAYTAAHWPMHAREEDIAKYRGRYAAGYQAIRQQRYERMVQQGLVKKDATTVLPVPAQPVPEDAAWDQRNMEVYAAMVDRMDQGVGRLIAELKAAGRLDNTLLCYMQDNGGCAENIGRNGKGAPRAEKPTLPPMPGTALSTELFPKQNREGYPVRQGRGVMAGPDDTYIAYGEAWAAVSNTPFREYKHWTHEGGISTPLIVHWPAGMAAARKGQLESEPGHLIDIMATCVDAAGATWPGEHAGQKIRPMEGKSLRPLLQGAPFQRTEPLYWEHEGNRAVRDGQWKLVAKENQPWELYDIDADRSEQKDLAASRADKVKELSAKWDAWAARADVLPLGAWRAKGGEGQKSKESAAARRFELKAGESLSGDKAPGIAGKPFRIQAAVTLPADSTGVIVAQGGTAHGYALHAAGGKLHFSVRAAGQLSTISIPAPAAGDHTLTAALSAEGRLSLKTGDAAPAEAAGKLIPNQPADGLDTGRDDGGLVGEYKGASPFSGTIKSVTIELLP